MDRALIVKKRKRSDNIWKGIIYSISSVSVITLVLIIGFLFSKGASLVSLDLITGDYASINADVTVLVDETNNFTKPDNLGEGSYFSSKFGIAFEDSKDREGHDIVIVSYIDKDSPFIKSTNVNATGDNGANEIIEVSKGATILTIFHDDGNYILSKKGAEAMIERLDTVDTIDYMTVQKTGGGIRGSLITTIYLVILTLLLSVPLGVSAAIYMNEYAKKNKFNDIIRSMIDMLTGVPSIIYGLMGAAVFIPMLSKITNGGSILSGALTMSIILLPTIIKSTEEALKIIPDEVRNASLALGASRFQTTFKVVLPSAIPGMLTGVLLGIGRVVGESAALIYAIGTVIRDDVALTEKSTTLAVQIWTVMGGEVPNVELASAIAIIILAIVLTLSICVKLLSKKLNKAWY